MNSLTELPEWVWDLLDALAAYEDEHGPLYRYTGGDGDGYERTGCFGAYLGGRSAWPPQEVTAAAEFRRHVLAQVEPTATEGTDHA